MGRIVRGETKKTGRTKVEDGKTWNIVTGGVSAIDDLNAGIDQFLKAIREDEIAAYSAEICLITFGGEKAEIVSDFDTVDKYTKKISLSAKGDTYMGEAVNMALDCLENRKQAYKYKGIDYYQPWLVIMTDGTSNGSQDELDTAISRTQKLVSEKKTFRFSLGSRSVS